MKQVILIVGVICIFVFIGCGQGEKGKQATQNETKEAAEALKEKAGAAVETVKEQTKEAVEVVKEKTGEIAEASKEKAEAAVEMVKEKNN